MQDKVVNFLWTTQTIHTILTQRFPNLPRAKIEELMAECFTATGCTPLEAAALVKPAVIVHDLDGHQWEFSEEIDDKPGYLFVASYSSRHHDGRTWAIVECLISTEDPDDIHTVWVATAGADDNEMAQDTFDTFDEAAAWAIDLFDQPAATEADK